MGTSLLGIGISGLQAAQAGLATTSHNIANAATPGFSRQEVMQSAAFANATSAGFVGQGTKVETVRRVYSEFLADQATLAHSQAIGFSSHHEFLAQVDNLVGDPAAGLTPMLEGFFAAAHDVAANPAAMSSRQTLISAGQSLAGRMQALDRQLDELMRRVNSEVTAGVNSINMLSGRIAELNDRILQASAVAGGQPPNDLLDRRDMLVNELAGIVGASIVRQNNGTYNVFVGGGQALVVGSHVTRLAAMSDPADASRMIVAVQTLADTVPLPEATLWGGTLGGALAFRAESLQPARNALDRIAAAIVQSVNMQHRLGQDANGVAGANFFVPATGHATAGSANTGSGAIAIEISQVDALTTSDYVLSYDGTQYTLLRKSDGVARIFAALPHTVDGITLSLSGIPAAGDSFLVRGAGGAAANMRVALVDPAGVAAALPVRAAAAAANSGSATLVIAGIQGPPPTDPNLRETVTIRFTGPDTFDITGTGTGNPSGLSYTQDGIISYNGWIARIQGTPSAGDEFTVGSNSDGLADARNVQQLASLQTANVLTGRSTIQSAYGMLVSDVGNRTRELGVAASAQDALSQQAEQAAQSHSGVSLDEEATNLLRYQQAYQASSKVMQIASRLFDDLLQIR